MSNQVVTHNQYQYSEEEPSIYNFNSKFMLGAFTCLVIVIAFVLFLHVYASWFLRWFQGSSSSSSTRMQDRTHILVLDGEHVSSRGLEACVVSSLPVFVYRCEGEKEGEMECAVCLSLFEDGEKGRVLPICNHGFHIKCIDSWLECSSTCPICRASAMPGSIDVEIEMGGGEVRQGSNTTSESNMDGTTMVERNPNGVSLLEVCVEISGSMVDQEQPQSACSSLSSLRRMLSKNRLEKKVFPSMGEEDMEKD